MIINVGLRFNRSSGKFWISGVTQKDKVILSILGNTYPKIENGLRDVFFNMSPCDDEHLEKMFEELTPRVENVFDTLIRKKAYCVKVTETEVVNNW